jgi:hypothetical protein
LYVIGIVTTYLCSVGSDFLSLSLSLLVASETFARTASGNNELTLDSHLKGLVRTYSADRYGTATLLLLLSLLFPLLCNTDTTFQSGFVQPHHRLGSRSNCVQLCTQDVQCWNRCGIARLQGVCLWNIHGGSQGQRLSHWYENQQLCCLRLERALRQTILTC